MKLANKFNLKLAYISVSTILTFVFFLLYMQFNKKLTEIEDNIIKSEISNVSKFAFNISKYIVLSTKGKQLEYFMNKPEEVRIIEDNLTLFKTSKYINIFLLSKEDDGKLRYLFDAEQDITKKGEIGQKFDPQNKIWEKVFEEKTPQYNTQKEIEELWVTYLHPIVVDREVKAVIVFDFSTNSYNDIVNIVLPLKNFFYYLTILMIIILILSYIQLYFQYKDKILLYKDHLTKVHNRQYLKNIVNKNINLELFEICLIDLDYFKTINDNYGHKAGDMVLKNFAKRIKNQIKEKDIFIRYGGEEFLLILYKGSGSIPMEVYERIRNLIANNPILLENSEINITASFGVNKNPHLSNSIEDAIERADEQLYISKNSGRNKVSYTNQ